MWTNECFTEWWLSNLTGDLRPVLVLPLDPASVQGMREKVAEYFLGLSPNEYVREALADEILAALNITTPRRTKGKKGGK